MTNVNTTFAQLPPAIGGLTGAEILPADQAGTTKKVTAGQIAALASSGQGNSAFVVVGAVPPTLPNGRSIAVGAALSLVDGGAGSTVTIGTSAFTGDVTTPVNSFATTIVNVPSSAVTGAVGAIVFCGASSLTTNDAKLHWDNTNFRLGIGQNAPDTPLTVNANTAVSSVIPSAGVLIHLVGADGNSSGIQIDTYGSNNFLNSRRANGTNALKTALNANDSIFTFGMQGYDGTSYGAVGNIQLIANENFSGTNHGSAIAFRTVANTTTTVNEVMRITGSNLLWGTTSTMQISNQTPTVQVVGASTAASFGVFREVVPGIGGAQFLFSSSRSTPHSGAFGALQTDDGLGSVAAGGDNGITTNNLGASILFSADGNWSGTSTPGRITFNTVPSGTTLASSTRMTIKNNGAIGFGTETNPLQSQWVFSQNATTGFFTSGLTTNGVTILNADGAGSYGFNVLTFGTSGLNLFARANNTAASPTALANNDVAGTIGFAGYYVTGGPSWTNARARILAFASENWDSTHTGMAFEFDTNAAGGNVRNPAFWVGAGIFVGTSFSDPGAGVGEAAAWRATPGTVASLPAAASGNKGQRRFVTDSNAASFTAGIGAVVAGGGTTNVPVTSDGSNWRIG